MQQAYKNRFSAKISALLVAILTLGSLPLAPKTKALLLTELTLKAPTILIEEGSGGTLLFELNRKLSEPVIISYELVPSGATAEAGVDYTLPGLTGTTGTFTMPANTLTFPVQITLNNDVEQEGTEMIQLDIIDQTSGGNPVRYGSSPSNILFLIDNDPIAPSVLPNITLDTDFRATTEDTTDISFNVLLSQTSTSDVIFDWSTDPWNPGVPSAFTNIADNNDLRNDYTSSLPGFDTVNHATIPAGESSMTINFTVKNDLLDEEDEEIVLVLFNVQNANPGSVDRITHRILDDDTSLVNFASIDPTDPFTIDEEDSSSTYQTQINLTNKSDRDITVSVEASSVLSTAIPGTDWELLTTSVTIPAGEISGPVNIKTINDAEVEDAEKIVLQLRSAGVNNIVGNNDTYTFTINPSDGFVAPSPAPSSGYGTAIPQATASVGGVAVGSEVTVPTPVVTTPVVTTPAPTTPGQVLGVQTSLVHELIAKLKFGSTSDEVKQLQVELQKLGFFPAKAKTTRYYGLVTKTAVQKYLDTKANEISLQDLAAMLKLGQRGVAVKKLQNELKVAGFFPANTAATGFYGNLTKQAVANYLAR